jgi:hypothetical protein
MEELNNEICFQTKRGSLLPQRLAEQLVFSSCLPRLPESDSDRKALAAESFKVVKEDGSLYS